VRRTTLCDQAIEHSDDVLAAETLSHLDCKRFPTEDIHHRQREMDSAPTGDAVTPAAMSAGYISLFQSDCIGLRAVLNVDWAVSGPSDSSGNFATVALTGSS
jgi:hypothetical protein